MKLNNSIYGMDRTRTLPPILANDPSTQGVAVAISKQMSKVASLIRINKIYPRIDELDETTLDILAHDLHVDWYDYTYDLEVKRAVIKNSVRIHMKLGTKYAVETATSDVYAESTVEEWFEYGSDPYFFRLNIDITSGGITFAQQVSLYEKIMFYKNCRSHLEYFNFQVKLETEIGLDSMVRLGGMAHSNTSIEVQPFLETTIDLENMAELGGVAQACTSIEIQPFLETGIDLETTVETKGAMKTGTSIEVQPFLETEIDLETSVESKGVMKTGTSIEVQPFLETEIDLETSVERKGAMKTGTSIQIQPFLETGIALETTMETKGATKTGTSVEVQPFLVKEISIEGGEVQTGAQTEITQKIKIKERENEQ